MAIVPKPLVTGISNFSSNLESPVDILNGILQVDLSGVTENSGRFLINSTLGIFGVFDIASRLGIYGKRTGFDQTLYTYGVREGAYTEIPAFGPNTERSAAGLLMSFAINPYGGVFKGAQSSDTHERKNFRLDGKTV